MSGNKEERNDENKNTGIKLWHIIAAASVFIAGIITALCARSAGFIPLIINILCALHIVFPATMVRRAIKSAVSSNSTVADIVRISAVIIAAFVDAIHFI